jgi:hypothetical protein
LTGQAVWWYGNRRWIFLFRFLCRVLELHGAPEVIIATGPYADPVWAAWPIVEAMGAREELWPPNALRGVMVML